MILVNKKSGEEIRSSNTNYIARKVGYSRRQVQRWARSIEKKELYSGWTVYVNEELYEKGEG